MDNASRQPVRRYWTLKGISRRIKLASNCYQAGSSSSPTKGYSWGSKAQLLCIKDRHRAFELSVDYLLTSRVWFLHSWEEYPQQCIVIGRVSPWITIQSSAPMILGYPLCMCNAQDLNPGLLHQGFPKLGSGPQVGSPNYFVGSPDD